MFRSIVLLEGKPSAQSKVLNALDWVFIKAISIFWCIKLFFYSDESFSPCRWKTAPRHETCPAHFTFGMVLGMCLVFFKHDAWKWVSSDQIILFLSVFFQMCFHVSTLKRGLSLKPRLLECCSDVCHSEDFSHLHIRSWSSTRVTIRFLVTTLTKALLHQLLSLARRPALGRVLLFQTSSFKGKRDDMLLWPFN